MSFCTNCGDALQPGVRFCTACGAKAGFAEAAKSEDPPVPTPAPAMAREELPKELPFQATVTAYPSSEDKPRRFSGLGVAIVLMIVAIGCAGIYLYLVPQRAKGPAPIIDGSKAAAQTGDTFGLEKYPGAHPITPTSTDMEQGIAAFETNDTPEQVIGFYRVRFPVSEFTVDPAHSTLRAEMNGRIVLVTADSLVRGSRVRVSFVNQSVPQ